MKRRPICQSVNLYGCLIADDEHDNDDDDTRLRNLDGRNLDDKVVDD
jgi:hypothetical protein